MSKSLGFYGETTKALRGTRKNRWEQALLKLVPPQWRDFDTIEECTDSYTSVVLMLLDYEVKPAFVRNLLSGTRAKTTKQYAKLWKKMLDVMSAWTRHRTLGFIVHVSGNGFLALLPDYTAQGCIYADIWRIGGKMVFASPSNFPDDCPTMELVDAKNLLQDLNWRYQ